MAMTIAEELLKIHQKIEIIDIVLNEIGNAIEIINNTIEDVKAKFEQLS